jgi:hypothetical protein
MLPGTNIGPVTTVTAHGMTQIQEFFATWQLGSFKTLMLMVIQHRYEVL